jgi:hypothetical protein
MTTGHPPAPAPFGGGGSATRWWNELPEGTVILSQFDGVREMRGGTWHGTDGKQIDPHWMDAPTTVLFTPVTDTEPPTGSIVVLDVGTMWARDPSPFLNGWVELGVASIGHLGKADPWPILRPHVTRILRWGR